MKPLILCTTTAFFLLASWARSAPAPGQEKEALAILDKAIEAHGGARKLDKVMVQMVVRETPSKFNGLDPGSVEISWKPPDKLRVYYPSDRKNDVAFVFNGDKAWKMDSRKTPIYMENGDSDLTSGAGQYVIWGAQLARYKNERYNLSLVVESKEADRKQVGIKAVPKKITKVTEAVILNAMREDFDLGRLSGVRAEKEKELEKARAAAKGADADETVKKLKEHLETIDNTIEERRRKVRAFFEKIPPGVQEQEPEVDLYFDKETGLLSKRSYKVTYQRLKPVTIQMDVVYDNYDETAGIRYPKKITTFSDGKKTEERVVTDFKVVDQLDDAMFEVPK